MSTSLLEHTHLKLPITKDFNSAGETNAYEPARAALSSASFGVRRDRAVVVVDLLESPPVGPSAWLGTLSWELGTAKSKEASAMGSSSSIGSRKSDLAMVVVTCGGEDGASPCVVEEAAAARVPSFFDCFLMITAGGKTDDARLLVSGGNETRRGIAEARWTAEAGAARRTRAFDCWSPASSTSVRTSARSSISNRGLAAHFKKLLARA